jgi:hypothetical protein
VQNFEFLFFFSNGVLERNGATFILLHFLVVYPFSFQIRVFSKAIMLYGKHADIMVKKINKLN